MKYKFVFKEIRRKNKVMSYVQERFDRLAHDWLQQASVSVKLYRRDYDYHVEAVVLSHGRYLKAQSNHESFHTAIDEVYDKIERQCYKRIHKDSEHRNPSHSREGFLERLNSQLEYDYYKHKKAA